MTQEYSWGHSRRFNAYSNYIKTMFGGRVQKLSLDAGFTCPNRDGTVGVGGCTFCNNEAFNPSYCESQKSVTQQLQEGVDFHAWRYARAMKYLAYFQAYSNTYKSVADLDLLYREALQFPNVIGLVIGTRPDCLTDEILKLIQGFNGNYHIHLEIGIESCLNKTLKRINRGHTFEKTQEMILKSASYGLHLGSHLILGLPGESRAEMLEQASIISQLPISTLKLHQLQILKGAAMENEYKLNPSSFSFFTLDEYVDFVIDFIERLRPSIVIERFAGEVPPRFQVGPTFGNVRNDQILNKIEAQLQKRNTWQGRLYEGD